MARGVLTFALALLVVTGVPPASGHVDGLDHTTPDGGVLAPGETHMHDLRFNQGPLQAGWVFIVNFYEFNTTAPAQVELVLGGEVKSQWSARPDGVNHLIRLLPETGNYSLVVRNPSDSEQISYAFFYDQSCNCIGKVLPPVDGNGTRLDGGIVVFNVDVEAGYRVLFNLTEPSAQKVKLAAATLANETAQWPQDYNILATSAPDVAFHKLVFESIESGRHYIFVESVEARPERFTGFERALIFPSITVESLDATGVETQAPSLLDSIRELAFSPLVVVAFLVIYLATYPLVFKRRGKKKE